MLRMFVDDSGIGQEPYYCLAGFVASDQTWQSFSSSWRAELAASPPVNCFKGVEWNGLRGNFRGLSREAANEKKLRLNKIIVDHQVLGYACVINHSDYISVFGTDRETHRLYSAYRILFNHLVVQVSEYLSLRGNDQDIEFVFDTQEGEDKKVLKTWTHSVKNSLPSVKTKLRTLPSFRSESEFGFEPLQAADMLAWQIRRSLWCHDVGKLEPVNIWDTGTEEETIGLVLDFIDRTSLVGVLVMKFYASMISNKIYPDNIIKPKYPEIYSPANWRASFDKYLCLPKWD